MAATVADRVTDVETTLLALRPAATAGMPADLVRAARALPAVRSRRSSWVVGASAMTVTAPDQPPTSLKFVHCLIGRERGIAIAERFGRHPDGAALVITSVGPAAAAGGRSTWTLSIARSVVHRIRGAVLDRTRIAELARRAGPGGASLEVAPIGVRARLARQGELESA